MPGILLNRLSRAKEGEDPKELLSKSRAILMGEILPALCPEAVEGEDYIYLEDIVSRMKVHEDGEILGQALAQMRTGTCKWLAVTEVARLSGSMGVADEIMCLCREHRIPIYTRERLHHPYQPWRAESEQELLIAFFVSALEVTGYRGRIQRARDAAYPIDVGTGESRLKHFQGLGRHMNGKVPRGYRWNRETKAVEPADRVPDDVPVPATGLTWWEIIKRLRELGRSMGSKEAHRRLTMETGVVMSQAAVCTIWRNPFYAGRPTSRVYHVGKKAVRRDQPVFTHGLYPAMETWEEHQQLQSVVSGRNLRSEKPHSQAWATGILRCECGQAFVGCDHISYICRGYRLRAQATTHENRRRLGIEPRPSPYRTPNDWRPSPSCGYIIRDRVHEHVTKSIREFYARPQIAALIQEYREGMEQSQPDRQQLMRGLDECEHALMDLNKRRQNLLDMGERGLLRAQELDARHHRLEKEIVSVENRKARLAKELSAPAVTPAAVTALTQLLTVDFDAFWAEATPRERAVIASAAIDHIPVTKPSGRSRKIGAPVFRL